MGVTYSTTAESGLRLDDESIKDTLLCYIQFRTQPIVDEEGLTTFIENSARIHRNEHFSNLEGNSLAINSSNLSSELWNTFSFESICYIQEILSALILLSSNSWSVRLSYLFDLFAGIDASQFSYEDVMYVAQVTATALSRLWRQSWDHAELSSISENLADDLFAKKGKTMDDCISKEEFLSWALERFSEDLNVESFSSLQDLYRSQY
mmetsp:Transcript_16394/g.22380  ORF Transcript_16394/g.22380 Transcript_16394/m.22380 type:complete len:208 (+) Transcript_16394:74-697(+)